MGRDDRRDLPPLRKPLPADLGAHWRDESRDQPPETDNNNRSDDIPKPANPLPGQEDSVPRGSIRGRSTGEGKEAKGPRRRKNKKKGTVKRLVLLSLLAGGFLVGGTIILVLLLKPHEPRLGAFANQMKDYTGPIKQKKPPASWQPTGKMVIVEANDKELHDFHFKLPAAMRAETPEEVRVLVLVTSGEIQVGTYGMKGKALRNLIHIRTYDWESGAELDNHSVYGSFPPGFSGGGSRSGGSASKTEAFQYILRLPDPK